MADRTLIIGAGIAGLWAALKLAPKPVTLLTGSPLGEGSASAWAQGGVSAALASDDSAALHAADTVRAGAGLVAPEAAQAMAEGAAVEVEALAALGAPFERDGHRWALSREAAHSAHRVARVKGDGAGAAIMATLIKAVRSAAHVELLEGWTAIQLLGDETGCSGALARGPQGDTTAITAAHTVLATGGAGGLFALTTTPAGAQGQAMAMAARLGAVIQDPEFVQFHPTALNADLDPAPLCTEALRGEGATLTDTSGKRFMKPVHDDAELAPRDVVARAVHRQNANGQGAYLDCREAIGEHFPDRFPAVFAACERAGIDPRIEPIPVAPTAHYHMGGVMTDIDGRTSIKGLWAIGECASSGLHGANRLASNSLAEGLVAAARCAKAVRTTTPRQPQPPRAGQHPENVEAAPALPPLALTRLRQAMSRHCGVERSQAGLWQLVELIDEIEARYGQSDAILAARFIATAALQREESRGGHFRTDYPETSPDARHTRLTLADLAVMHASRRSNALPAE
ncbi:L-aspartate oxidase [Maricaulis sp.]|uniref:L-aspartate oxidase n=1 Tax=Maricaulis sp. TaxID=1486257 RepID=UPI00262FDBD1|nr:L-aspartate oxidase [Maricaulis sp.]